MDRGTFMGSFLFGMAIALAIFYPLGAKRRTRIPSLAWWTCLVLGVVMSIYGLSHATAPSFAPRITAVGKTYDYVDRKDGRDSYHGFRLIPDDGSKPIDLETSIIIPSWAMPEVFNGRTFRVVYLQSSGRAMNNEAIDIQILSGRHAGYHESVDARPLGVWLGIPFGGAIAAFGYFGLRYMGSDEKEAAAQDDDTA